jgi:hypothetical protein
MKTSKVLESVKIICKSSSCLRRTSPDFFPANDDSVDFQLTPASAKARKLAGADRDDGKDPTMACAIISITYADIFLGRI